MASRASKLVLDLDPAADEAVREGIGGTATTEPELELADLIRDEKGEVVLFNDSGLRTLRVGTRAALIDEGEVGSHVTAAGEDVTGYRYYAFDDGLRLYFQPDLELILVRPGG